MPWFGKRATPSFEGMRKIALAGFLGGCALLGAACGTAAAVQCRVDAVNFLPRDPRQVTPGDVADLVGRLNACELPAVTPPGDAGTR